MLNVLLWLLNACSNAAVNLANYEYERDAPRANHTEVLPGSP